MKKLLLFILLSMSVFSAYRVENKKVYYDDKLVKSADIKSFEILRNGIAYDKKNLYIDGELVDKKKEVKIGKFLFCSAPKIVIFDVPRCHIYFITYNDTKEYRYFSEEDADKVGEEAARYFKDMNKLVKTMEKLNYTVSPEFDLEMFTDLEIFTEDYKKLSYVYFSNEKKIYTNNLFRGGSKEVEKADFETFKIIENNNEYDAEDKNNYYKYGEIVKVK